MGELASSRPVHNNDWGFGRCGLRKECTEELNRIRLKSDLQSQ